MVSIEGVDYSYARPTAAAVKAADKKFVVRYITPAGHNAKGISQTEFDALHKEGIAVVAVYEQGAGGMKNGHAAGVRDGEDAQKQLRAIIGLDDKLPVYFACDFDAAPSDQAAINAYLDGAATVLGRDRVGVYGSYYVCKRVKAAGKAHWLWQTYAWSGGNVLEGIHLYQYKNGVPLAGGTVDLCRALQAEYGQHGVQPPAPVKPAPSIPVAPPKPVPAPEPVTPPVVVPEPTVNEQNLADEANADFKSDGFKGTYYFKGTGSGDVFVLDTVTGKKRHVSPAEWAVIKGYGHNLVYVIPQAEADQIKS